MPGHSTMVSPLRPHLHPLLCFMMPQHLKTHKHRKEDREEERQQASFCLVSHLMDSELLMSDLKYELWFCVRQLSCRSNVKMTLQHVSYHVTSLK